MAKFPKEEAAVVSLAESLGSGLAANGTLYPAPPLSAAAIQGLREAFVAARVAATAAQGVAQQATAAKDEALVALKDGMKAVLRYAEDAVHRDDAKLKLLGWGATAARTHPSALLPGAPTALEAPRQGPDWILLDWNAPADGGPVQAYRIQRRLCPDGVWTDIGTALESVAKLTAQERGREWEYRIIAVNKAGESAPSNTVTVVL